MNIVQMGVLVAAFFLLVWMIHWVGMIREYRRFEDYLCKNKQLCAWCCFRNYSDFYRYGYEVSHFCKCRKGQDGEQ